MKTLAISILNWNSIKDTIKCLDSLKKSTLKDFDIFLLDNGSKNDEYEKLKNIYKEEKNIILNYSKNNLGFTGGNNFNLKLILKSNYKYALLLNNDTIIPENFLGDFIAGVKKINEIGIFGPEIRNKDNSIQSIGNTINLYTGGGKRFKKFNKNNNTDYISGSCFLIDNKIFKDIGLLDNNFFAYFEESDFCLRAKKHGYSTYIIPNTYIYHKEETANKKDKPYYCYLMFRNRILFLKKHSNFFQYIISYIFLVGYLIIIFPNMFGFKNYKYALKAINDGIKGKGGVVVL